MCSTSTRWRSRWLTIEKVHESFRSENILFFLKSDCQEKNAIPISRVDLAEPWVLGFEFSRPEAYFTAGLGDACLARNIYRHPDRQQSPKQPFTKLHDIYAMGIVLLEIGACPFLIQ